MKASVSPEADRELAESALYYARQGGKDVGSAFIAEYEKALVMLCAYPELGAPWREHSRRFPMRKFPYSVIYYVHGEELRVVALAHHRRKPGYWAGRT